MYQLEGREYFRWLPYPKKASILDAMDTFNVEPSTLFHHDNLAVLQGINPGCINLFFFGTPFIKEKNFTAPDKNVAESATFRDKTEEDDIPEERLQYIERKNPSLHDFIWSEERFFGKFDQCSFACMAIQLPECRRIPKHTSFKYLCRNPSTSHFPKLVMGYIFGEENFTKETVCAYPPGGSGPRVGFNRKHDVLFLYAIFPQQGLFHRPYTHITESTAGKFTKTERCGSKHTEYPGDLSYPDESPGRPVPDWWVDIHTLGQTVSRESTGYPTPKPFALLERIIKASSWDGGIVLSPFCGCTTTCIAAEKLKRRWIGNEVSQKAIELLETRLRKEVDPELNQSQPILRATPPSCKITDRTGWTLHV